MQHGSATVDTWVLTDGPVDPGSLQPAPLAVADLAGRQRTVTSRAAENLYWLGRYTERSDNCVRLARLALETLGTASPPVLDALGQLALRNGLVGADAASPVRSARAFEHALVQAMGDAEGATSIAFDLRALRRCAQSAPCCSIPCGGRSKRREHVGRFTSHFPSTR